MFNKIKMKILNWYRGDSGDIKWDPLTNTFIGTTKPTKHWTANTCIYFINILKKLLSFFAQNWNGVITNILSAIAIFIAGYTLYLQINENKEEDKRCTITSTDQNFVHLKCRN